jgi:hypothetical protein
MAAETTTTTTDTTTGASTTPGIRQFTDAEFSQETARIHTGGRMEGTRRAVSKIAEIGKKYGVEITSDDPDEVARVLDSHLGKLTAPKGGKGAKNGNEDAPDVEQIARERDELLNERNELAARYERTMLENAINRAISTADVADAELAFAGFTREFEFKMGKSGEIEVLKNGQRVREGYKDLTVAEAFAGWIKNKPVLLKPTNTGGRSATDRGAGSPISAGNYDPKNPPKPGSAEADVMLRAAGMRKT